MQILSLQMRNFKRYRNQDVTFRDGITGILGNNGTGKSTIVDAILFCFFGVKETGLDYIISATAGPREKAEVRLDFSVRGEDFQLVRSLGPGKKHEVSLHRGGRLFAKGVSDVHDALQMIIRMGQADFRHTIFSGQKELLTLLVARPGDRKEWFRKVLGIDNLRDKGGEILRREVKDAQDQALLIEGRLKDVSREEIQKQREYMELKIAEAGKGILMLDEEQDTLGKRTISLEAGRRDLLEREKQDFSARHEMERREQEAAEVRNDIAGVAAGIEALEGHREEFERLAAAEAGFEPLRERRNTSAEQFRIFQSLTEKEKERRARTDELEAELLHLRDDDARLRTDEERMKVLAPSEVRREDARVRLLRLRELEELARILAAGIERKEAAIAELVKRGAVLRSRIEQGREAGERLAALARKAELAVSIREDPLKLLEDRHRELLHTIADGDAAIENAKQDTERLKTSLATLEAQGPEGTCPTCRQPLGLRHQDLVAEIREEIRFLGERTASLEEDLATKRQDLGALEALLDEARNLTVACSHQREVTDEWEEVQERTLTEISGKEQLEEQVSTLGYRPEERQAAERELDALEGPLREYAIIADRVKRRPALAAKIRELEVRLAQLKEESADILREKRDLGFDPGIHRDLEEEYRKADASHRRYLILRPEMDRLPVLREQAAALKIRGEQVEKAMADLRVALDRIAFTPSDLDRVNGDIRSLQEHALDLRGRLDTFRSERSHLETERDRLTVGLERLEREKGEYDRLKEEIQLLELTRDHLNGFTDHLLGVVRDQVQDETGRILAEITDGRYDTVILDDNFELRVHDLGGDYPVARFSGGEQDDVAIALRIALSRYIAEMHELHDSTFLIFDEIFGSQDEERRGNIFRALRALEPYFPQIFLISHVTEVQGEFGSTLVVEAVSESESRIRDLEGAEA